MLVADGVHMGTHVIAFAVAGFAYWYSAKHSNDPRFVFGTGKVGELAGFTCALILIGISLLILYSAIDRLINPSRIKYLEALPIAGVGLTVNVLSGIILMGLCESSNSNHFHSHHQYQFEDKGYYYYH